MTPTEFAAERIARCAAGFQNEHEHAASLRKHRKAIDKLPPPLRHKVLLAYEQATWDGYSRPVAK